MPPSVFVELGLKALGQARLFAFCRGVTARAGHTGAATGAGVLTLPWPAWVLLTDPAAALTLGALRHALVPILGASNQGLTSAPRFSQILQVNLGSRSDNRTLSGHLSTSAGVILSEWLQR